MKLKLLTALCLLSLATAPLIHAAPVGFSIDPPLLRVQIKPGKSITKIFKIENKQDSDKSVVARLVPFNKSDSQGNPIVDVKNTANWLRFFSLSNSNIKLNEPFIIKGKSSEQLILSITIPETANLEDLYLTLLVSTYDNSLESDLKGSLISATIGANMLISVTSDLNPATILKIEKIEPISGSFTKFSRQYLADNLSPLTFTALVKNSGKFTTETKGIFKVAKNNLPVYLDGVLPQYIISGSERRLLNSDGKNFSFTPTISNIGQHKISIEIKSDNTNTENSIDIFFFPFKATGGLILLTIILRLVLKSTKSKKVE